jgi:hypothetical protein
MALPDVSFTNNLGTIVFKRALVDIADQFTSDGRSVVRAKRVTVDAQVARATAERLEGVMGASAPGLPGTLTLPWGAISNVKIESLEADVGAWQDFCPVTVSFLDDRPENNIYTLMVMGYELHNPRITMPVAAKRTYDYYLQIPSQQQGAIAPSNPYYGPIRFRTGYGMMEINISGSLVLPSGTLPEGLRERLVQRIGVDPPVMDGYTEIVNLATTLPPGYPKVFRLKDAIPQIDGQLSTTCVFVASGKVIWDIEKLSARVNLTLLAQPQAWRGVEAGGGN